MKSTKEVIIMECDQCGKIESNDHESLRDYSFGDWIEVTYKECKIYDVYPSLTCKTVCSWECMKEFCDSKLVHMISGNISDLPTGSIDMSSLKNCKWGSEAGSLCGLSEPVNVNEVAADAAGENIDN
jgi:hypothetical protein